MDTGQEGPSLPGAGGPRGRHGRRSQGTSSGNAILTIAQRIGLDKRQSSWMERANCLDKDPEMFFPGPGGLSSETREVCNACPVREECLEYGRHEEYGIWGGTSYRSRQKRGEFQRDMCSGGCGNRLANNTELDVCAWCDADEKRGLRRRTKILQERARRAGKAPTVSLRATPLEAAVAGIIRGVEALGPEATRPALYKRLAANRRPSFEQAMLQLQDRITERDGVIYLD